MRLAGAAAIAWLWFTVVAESVDELREQPRADGRFWGDCRCGRPLDRHSRRKVPNAGIEEYTCGLTDSGRYEPVTLPELDYTPARGLHRP